MPSASLMTPTGPFCIVEQDGALIRANWSHSPVQDDTALLSQAKSQILAYFAGEIRDFDLPLSPQGSPFQIAVCAEILKIPFGDTKTYKDLAIALNAPPQAIGQGCGGNSLPLFIPCHRVTSSTGLGGFSGGTGIETKVWLLKHEGAASLLI